MNAERSSAWLHYFYIRQFMFTVFIYQVLLCVLAEAPPINKTPLHIVQKCWNTVHRNAGTVLM